MTKQMLIFFFSLLLFAAAAATATAQAKPKLAVFVVGMDDWMLGDVLAHIVGEELNRGKNLQVVTRSNAAQQKLKALRRSSESVEVCDLHEWSVAHGVAHLCLITTQDNRNFSAQLLDRSSSPMLCSGSSISDGLRAVDLKQLAWSLAGQLRSGCTPSFCYEREIGLEMVYVEGGTFRMGCKSGRDDAKDDPCSSNECPPNDNDTVADVDTFVVTKYEVTQAQWYAVMEKSIQQQLDVHNSQYETLESLNRVGPDYPMYYVSWHDAKAFCDTLSARTGKTYRLPTEAEWEYAARGGNKSKGYKYSGSNTANDVAWHSGNSSNGVQVVGSASKSGNELGIYDMSGNVMEWCLDNWTYGNCTNSESEAACRMRRMLRGGSWVHEESCSRIAYRNAHHPYSNYSNVGFRVV
jgi:formylglycine-generating enzyme required for sulfatase activity